MKVNSTKPSFKKMINSSNMLHIKKPFTLDNGYSALVLISFRLNKKIEIFLNYGTFKRYCTGGMVHGTRVKIMVRLDNYGMVWQRCGQASTLTARPNIHSAKVVLCIRWDQLDVVYYEQSKPSETITSGDRY